MSDTTEVLQQALAVLHERGWHQGGYENRETGALCGFGAICAVVGEKTFFTNQRHPAAVALNAQVPQYVTEGDEPGTWEPHFPTFNDDSHTTFEDVVVVFEQAIAESKREAS